MCTKHSKTLSCVLNFWRKLHQPRMVGLSPPPWWSLLLLALILQIAVSFRPTLAKLARAFLAIPATSAASERIWSRASQVLSIRRSRMDPELAQRIMYTRENNRLLHMYYEELTEKPVADAYLPPSPLRDTETDIGQHDHLLLFWDMLNEMMMMGGCCAAWVSWGAWNKNRLTWLLIY